jgi:4-hydroxy-tetrahydrodipicolinate synthase
MKLKKFEGTGVAIITPFRKDDSIDFKALGKLLHHLLQGQVEYLVVLGTTGESVTLRQDEKDAIVEFVKDTVDGKIPIVVGIGGNNTQEVAAKISQMNYKGIAGVLSVAPYYNKPGQRGLYQHFKVVAEECPVPVIIYNVPGRTGSNMAAETTVKLAQDFSNIIAVKEASGNLVQIMDILRSKPSGFQVISGDDALTLPMIALGGCGVISVVANALPLEWSTMVRHALAGNYEEARKLHYKLLPFAILLFAEGSPAGVKSALATMNIIPNYLRLPLTPVSKNLQALIASELEVIAK